MKAIRVHEFGAPELMRLDDVPEPKLGPGQLLVRMKAAGVNPVETYIRAGTYALKPSLPYTPGTDGAGVVERAEPAAGFKPGDRVYLGGSVSGTYAELSVCEPWQAHPLPAKLSFAQGAAVHVPYATAYLSLFDRAQSRPGESVLVHGASGGVGIAAVQLARAHGMRTLGTAGTEQGLELVSEQGADEVFNHRSADYLKAILDSTGGRGVDVIVEMLANVNLAKDLSLLAKRGRVVVVGSRGAVEINPRELMGRNGAIMGMSMLNVAVEELVRTHAALAAGLGNGSLNPVVGRELPLAEAAKAHRAVLEPGARGKIILVCG